MQGLIHTQTSVFVRAFSTSRPRISTRSLHNLISLSASHTRTVTGLRSCTPPRRHLSTSISTRATSSGLSGDTELFLIVYSKPGCHLCDGLKDKISAMLDEAMFQPSPLSKASLQIRNILDEPEWEKAYGMSIPVMTAIKRGESEEIKIPRAPPRITADRLHKHIVEALQL